LSNVISIAIKNLPTYGRTKDGNMNSEEAWEGRGKREKD